ncbi:gag-pol polyprotein [Tanacetum coccineum]
MSGMISCLNDLSYIPLNNEQNEPTQKDIGETSNKLTQDKCNEFEELYASANVDLYPGCNFVIRLDFMAKFTHFKGEDNKDKQLQRLYKSSHTAKEMTWHATGKCTEPSKTQHPVDGRAWKNFNTQYPDFVADPRNVRLGLAVDGFNPFGNLSQSYSMWLVILTTYNLPPWLCMKESSLMLTLLIPGPKSLGKDIDVYLRPLIDDLKDLWALKGVKTIDVATGQTFNTKAMLLWTINAFSARSSLYGGVGKSQLVDILCNLEQIYPPAFFDVMIHLVIYLPQEALEGGIVPNRWMYPFVRYMKKLENYVREKKPKGLIVKGYVAEAALTFSSHYFWDLTTKFNRPDRNVDCPPPTCQFHVFQSICKSIGKWLVIRLDGQELKKYVLYHSPEIDIYLAKFKSRDERRTTQNNSICSPGEKDGEMYYGQLEKILEFSYMSFKVLLYRVKWFDTSNEGRKIKRFVIRNNITQIWKVVQDVNHKKFSSGGVIVVEDDHDVIHFDNSFDLELSTCLNDLDFATLNIDGQSMDVDATPDINDVDEDGDSIDDEDVIPHDLADSDDEVITTQEFSSNEKPILLLSQLYGEIFRFITLLIYLSMS